MPLGGIFGGSSSSNKPQVLTDGSSSKKEAKTLNESNCKGVSLKLTNTQVTIEKQLAEGGFAIVYLVTDKKNRKFALKRQFVLDNQKQLEACIRECKIVSELRGNKNIVEYVDHLVAMNKSGGQYDCMLLTVYHKRNVLQLMNDRISNNLYLTPNEVLNIFCDMCEAVGRLHHSQTPVVHRDLKVENILIDERNRAAPPIFVLCDFGSATTKTMSINTHSASAIQDEIERNTTLCYRSPEMIDIYGGQPIGTKSDMWSMGVMLYRLCYFSLPFEESALAIQNGSYTPFPLNPDYPAAIRALIYILLDVDVQRRPSIYECASLAFEAYGKQIPLENVYNVTKPSLEQAILDMKEGKPLNQPRKPSPLKPPVASQPAQVDQPVVELISTVEDVPKAILSGAGIIELTTTSVNPRLRPKANTIITAIPSISPVPSLRMPKPSKEEFREPALPECRQSFSGETVNTFQLDASNGFSVEKEGGPLSCPLLKPSDLGFTDLDNPTVPRNRAATDSLNQRPVVASSQNSASSSSKFKPSENPHNTQQHRRNVSDTSQISKSAFKPYSQTAIPTKAQNQVKSVEDVTKTKSGTVEWNPFLAAPFSTSPINHQTHEGMDDSHFGQAFDELPRREAPFNDDEDDDTSSIDSRDPFGAAPFDQLTGSTSSSLKNPAVDDDGVHSDEMMLISKSEEENQEGGIDEVDGKREESLPEEDSEVDEQRMRARRRYSYENIDGVGDDASSDSRGRTDRDDSEDDDDETDGCSRREEGDTSHDEDGGGSSQNTVGSEDGEGGNRPLLEDDGLEDDDDHELLSSFSSITSRLPYESPIFVGTNISTNPFLRDELTPKMVSPNVAGSHFDTKAWENVNLNVNLKQVNTDDDWDLGDRWTDRRDTVLERPNFAPATLPRQATPLSAVNRFKPDLPSHAPVSIIPSMSTTSFPETIDNKEEIPQTCEPIVGTLIQVEPSNTDREKPVTIIPLPQPRTSILSSTVVPIDFVEGPKTPKSVGKLKKKSRGPIDLSAELNSDPETDGSEAEMCTDGNGSATLGKKKKKTFGIRSSHPSIMASDLQFISPIPPVVKKSSKEKKSSSTVKRASTGTLNNSSFVNTSFQYEDMDMPTSTVQRF